MVGSLRLAGGILLSERISTRIATIHSEPVCPAADLVPAAAELELRDERGGAAVHAAAAPRRGAADGLPPQPYPGGPAAVVSPVRCGGGEDALGIRR